MKKIILISALFCINIIWAQPMPLLFGVAETGGDSATGVLYQIGGWQGYQQTIHDFVSSSGCNPKGTLIWASDGNLYGTTTAGCANGKGGIFRFDLSTYTYSNLYSFSSASGTDPCNKMLEASDGKFYGMTAAGGSNNSGVLFSFDPFNNTFSKLVDLGGGLGEINQIPYAGIDLIQASNGKLYGLTPFGGSNNTGVLFSYDINTNNFQKLYDFNQMWGPDGQFPVGKLTELSPGKLYGVCSQGGLTGWGTIFKFDINQNVFMKLHDLDDTLAESGPNGLLLASNGRVYLTCQTGSWHAGSIFEFDTLNNQLVNLYTNSNWNNGSMINQDMIMASDGMLYGVTMRGGSWGNGTIFSLNPNTLQDSTLSVFPCGHISGQAPAGGLVEVNNSLNEIVAQQKNKCIVFPIPANNKVLIQSEQIIQRFEIADNLGKVIEGVRSVSTKEGLLELHVSDLPSGVYFLKITQGNSTLRHKLIIEH